MPGCSAKSRGAPPDLRYSKKLVSRHEKKLSPGGVSRRGALRVAAGALGPALLAQNRNQTPLAASDQAEVDVKFANIIRKYGDRLSEEQRTRVRGVLARHQRMLARVRAFPLENSDSPATGLRLVPTDTAEPKPGGKRG